jgi:hypothetical protein
MTEPITLEQIATAYEAVRASFGGYCAFREAVGDLFCGLAEVRRKDTAAMPDETMVTAIANAREDMRRFHNRAEEALTTGVRWHLRVLDGPVVAHGNHRAESYADLVQVLVQYTVAHAWTDEEMRACSDLVWNQFSFLVPGYPVDVAEIPPALNKERAHLEDRAIQSCDGIPYANVRANLPEQSCELLVLLLENVGETVDRRVIAERVWHNRHEPQKNITAGIRRLRERLREMDMDMLADRIESRHGAYCLIRR